MRKTFYLFGFAAALILSLGLMFACGDDDDDDDSGGTSYNCQDLYTEMDQCGIHLKDANGDNIPINEVIASCKAADPADYNLDSDIAACIRDNLGDCNAMLECLTALFE